MNVMIFSVSIGHGHNQVAKALELELKAHRHTVRVIDALEFVSPFFSKVLLESYLRMLRFTPSIYGRLYQLADEPTFFDFASIINSLLCSGFRKLMSQFEPDAIVCTHPFPTGLLSALKLKLGIDMPLVAVMTDYTVHYSWVHPGVNTYITPSTKLSYQLHFMGVDDTKIMPVGIPIRPKFIKPPAKARARKSLQLTNSPTILVMGGGLGIGTSSELIQVVDHNLAGCQILVVTGKNESLHQALIASDYKNAVQVFAYVDEIEVLMSAADLLLTKPGGVTAAEALSMGLPLALLSPIPGQEWRNAVFLVEQLVAVQLEVATLAPKLADLLHDPMRLACMSKLGKHISKPNSTHDAVTLLESFYR